MRGQKLAEVKWSGDAHCQGVLKFLVGALIDPPHDGKCVIHQNIHMTVPGKHIFRKGLQYHFVRNIAYIMAARCLVDDGDDGTGFAEFLRNTLADAGGTAGDDYHFILKHTGFPLLY